MNIDKVIGRRKRRTLMHAGKPKAGRNVPDAEIVRHTRKCRICNHPRRAELEQDSLNWRNPHEIVEEYELAHHSAIYRHAQALGLTAQRVENACAALDLIVEKVEDAHVTGHTIIRAMRAYSCLTPRGRWVELPKRVIYETVRKSPAPEPAAKPAAKPASKPDSPPQEATPTAEILIANARLENRANH
jgi:hypothetical protein